MFSTISMHTHSFDFEFDVIYRQIWTFIMRTNFSWEWEWKRYKTRRGCEETSHTSMHTFIILKVHFSWIFKCKSYFSYTHMSHTRSLNFSSGSNFSMLKQSKSSQIYVRLFFELFYGIWGRQRRDWMGRKYIHCDLCAHIYLFIMNLHNISTFFDIIYILNLVRVVSPRVKFFSIVVISWKICIMINWADIAPATSSSSSSPPPPICLAVSM